MVKQRYQYQNIEIIFSLPSVESLNLLRSLIQPGFYICEDEVDEIYRDWVLEVTVNEEKPLFPKESNPKLVLEPGLIEYSITHFSNKYVELTVPETVNNGLYKVIINRKEKYCNLLVEDDAYSARWASRIGKHIVASSILGEGGLFLHASCSSVDGLGVVYAGKSGSGKSSMNFLMCFLGGAKFLSDDTIHFPGGNDIAAWPKRAAVGCSLLNQLDAYSNIRIGELRRTNLVGNPENAKKYTYTHM